MLKPKQRFFYMMAGVSSEEDKTENGVQSLQEPSQTVLEKQGYLNLFSLPENLKHFSFPETLKNLSFPETLKNVSLPETLRNFSFSEVFSLRLPIPSASIWSNKYVFFILFVIIVSMISLFIILQPTPFTEGSPFSSSILGLKVNEKQNNFDDFLEQESFLEIRNGTESSEKPSPQSDLREEKNFTESINMNQKKNEPNYLPEKARETKETGDTDPLSLSKNYSSLFSNEECKPSLKVYVVDLPRKFNFGMFRSEPSMDSKASEPWDTNEFPDLPFQKGNVKHQHSMTYYLMADLLLKHEDEAKRTIASRVSDPSQADVFFVPFFSSISYNKFGKYAEEDKDYDRDLQVELVSFLDNSKWWRRSGGRDHIICTTHPNALKHVREELGNATFILVDFDRLSRKAGRLSKDIIAPYRHLAPTYVEDKEESGMDPYNNRTLLLFFQGTVKRKQAGWIRKKMKEMFKGDADVFFEDIRPTVETLQTASIGMRSSKFCLHPAGDTASSCRLFDAIASHCIPVIVSDNLDLPFENELNYKEFCLFVSSTDAVKEGYMLKLLRSIEKDKWMMMWRKLLSMEHHFQFHIPAFRDDAVGMLWDQIYKKLPNIRLSINRRQRLVVPEWWELRRRTLL